jgi:hypothetical protein
VATLNDKLAVLLDIHKLLSDDELAALNSVN